MTTQQRKIVSISALTLIVIAQTFVMFAVIMIGKNDPLTTRIGFSLVGMAWWFAVNYALRRATKILREWTWSESRK